MTRSTKMLPFNPSPIKKDDLDCIGDGLSCIVVHMQDTNYVVKTSNPSTKTKMPRGGFMSIYRVTAVTPTNSNTLEGALLNMSYYEIG